MNDSAIDTAWTIASPESYDLLAHRLATHSLSSKFGWNAPLARQYSPTETHRFDDAKMENRLVLHYLVCRQKRPCSACCAAPASPEVAVSRFLSHTACLKSTSFVALRLTSGAGETACVCILQCRAASQLVLLTSAEKP